VQKAQRRPPASTTPAYLLSISSGNAVGKLTGVPQNLVSRGSPPQIIGNGKGQKLTNASQMVVGRRFGEPQAKGDSMLKRQGISYKAKTTGGAYAF
jgi:hypothetical protein